MNPIYYRYVILGFICALLYGCGTFYKEISFRPGNTEGWNSADPKGKGYGNYVFDCNDRKISAFPVSWEKTPKVHHIAIIPIPSFEKEQDRSDEIRYLEYTFDKKYHSKNIFLLHVNYINIFSGSEIERPRLMIGKKNYYPIDGKKITWTHKEIRPSGFNGITCWYLFDVDLFNVNTFSLILGISGEEKCLPPPLLFKKVEMNRWMMQGLAP